MEVYVNSKCIGCGFCINLCPDIFYENSDGTSRACKGLIPSNAEVMVIEAKTNCPVTAIETSGH